MRDHEARAATGGQGAASAAGGVDDDTLASAARRDPDAFADLYRRHLDRVYGYLLARVADVALAQDLTAQTFLAALEGIAGYRGRGQFPGWLLGIARNKAADHYRRSRPEVPLEEVEIMADSGPPLEQIVAGRLQRARVLRALQALAPDRAEALALRLFGELSAAEAARVLGKTEAAVKMLVHRAMRDLQARLAVDREAEP